MMRIIVEGDNGESKLVFVLHSRHEALVGTMGDPVLQTLASTLASILAQVQSEMHTQVHG